MGNFKTGRLGYLQPSLKMIWRLVGATTLVFTLATLAASRSSNKQDVVSDLDAADAGNWTVGDCILAQFAMEVKVHYSSNDSMVVDVSPAAKVNNDVSVCGQARQTLSLAWFEPASNDSSVKLNRSLTIDFGVVANKTHYGIRRLSARFDLASWHEEVDNVTRTSFVKIDSGADADDDDAKLLFRTPINRSFLCANVGNVELETSLYYDTDLNEATEVANSTLVTKRVQFDAFRPKDKGPHGFRTPHDCDYHPNDIVPIAVGTVLILLIVGVLVSYFVGRFRYQRSAYESI